MVYQLLYTAAFLSVATREATIPVTSLDNGGFSSTASDALCKLVKAERSMVGKGNDKMVSLP
jgi:hypothetical protein